MKNVVIELFTEILQCHIATTAVKLRQRKSHECSKRLKYAFNVLLGISKKVEHFLVIKHKSH